MGSTSYYTQQDGSVYDSHVYDVWGSVQWSSGHGVNDGKTAVIEPNYTGHNYDPVLEIYFAEARFYDAKNRQWMASDPIKSGINWYQYGASNPTTYVDPDGKAINLITAAAGAFIGAAVNVATTYVTNAIVQKTFTPDVAPKTYLASAVSGAVAGGFAGLTMGASVVVGAGIAATAATTTATTYLTTRAATNFATGTMIGYTDSAVRQMVENDGRVDQGKAWSEALMSGTVQMGFGGIVDARALNQAGGNVLALYQPPRYDVPLECKPTESTFPQDPNDFIPEGLTSKSFATKNGKITKWFDSNGRAVFEWDEDISNGSHYHVIGDDGNTRLPDDSGETHFSGGDSIPDLPWEK